MVTERLCLFSYWRSSAAYRVRIGLNLKGLGYELMPVHLLREGMPLTPVDHDNRRVDAAAAANSVAAN